MNIRKSIYTLTDQQLQDFKGELELRLDRALAGV